MEKINHLTLEVTINSKTCRLSIPMGMSFGAAIDATHQMYMEVIKMAQEAAEQAKPEIKDE